MTTTQVMVKMIRRKKSSETKVSPKDVVRDKRSSDTG